MPNRRGNGRNNMPLDSTMPKNSVKLRVEKYLATIESAGSGGRNCLLHNIGLKLRATFGLHGRDLRDWLDACNQSKCSPPLSDVEVSLVAGSVDSSDIPQGDPGKSGAKNSPPCPAKPIFKGESLPPLDINYQRYFWQKWGRPDVTYTYCNVDGTFLYDIWRWNNVGGEKEVRPDRKGLTIANRVPYQLNYLLTAAEIYICEGEKSADALNRDFEIADAENGIFQRIATTAGASNYSGVWDRALQNPVLKECFRFVDGSPKPIFIIPDNDAAGVESAQKTARIFLKHGFKPIITGFVSNKKGGDYADL